MTFLALIVFFDPPKTGVVEALADLRSLGITTKVITGDNTQVATSVARKVLEYEPNVLTGPELHLLSDEALLSRAPATDVFAEIEPSQKELAMVSVLVITLALPYSPLSGMLGLTPFPFSSIALLGLITALYAGVSEFTKKLFYVRVCGKEIHKVKRVCMPLLLKCDSSLMIGTQYGTRAFC